MKGKGGAMDRRSSTRWRMLVLCAFSFGLGMLFTDRWVSLSVSLSLPRGKLWISPCASFALGVLGDPYLALAGRRIEKIELLRLVSRLRFRV